MQNKTTLYTVKGHEGAHLLIDVRDTDSGTIADVQLIGKPLPFSAQMADLAPFTLDHMLTNAEIICQLAQEAATVYNLDPARIQRAAELARDPHAVQNARRDYMGEQIKSPSMKTQIVKGRTGWYIVERGNCQCPDNGKGNVCKHRIAAWMRRESTARPIAAARRVEISKIYAELEA